jgi:hypothetical protein
MLVTSSWFIVEAENGPLKLAFCVLMVSELNPDVVKDEMPPVQLTVEPEVGLAGVHWATAGAGQARQPKARAEMTSAAIRRTASPRPNRR